MTSEGYPADGYLGDLVVDDADLAGACTVLLAALGHKPWPAVSSWTSPIEGKARRGSPLKALERGEVEQQIRWRHGDDIVFTVAQLEDRVTIRLAIYDTQPEHAWRWLGAVEELLARLLEAGLAIRQGVVEREGTGVKCLPRFELMGGPSYLVVTHDAALEWGFEEPDRVGRDGGWDEREIGGYRLLSRAMHAETNVELLEAIQDGQWAMARLAKPDQARYDTIGPPQPEEEAIFRSGEPLVHSVGYDRSARTATFSCAPDEDTHINGWEILALRDIVAEGRLPSGEDVERVEVIFSDRAAAVRERRPLLDVGVHVWFYDQGGQRVELET